MNRKTGRVKLESDEVRVGNFFVRREEGHVKLCDLNGVFSFRASRRVALGVWLENVWSRAMNGDEGAVATLRAYVGTMWSVFSVAPDDGFVGDLLVAAGDALSRHPDWYGVDAGGTDAEHEAAATEVREMAEFEEEVRGAVEGLGDED